MRSIALVGLVACTELPPLPQIDSSVDWNCADGFDEAIVECTDNTCPGFMSMSTPVDSEDVEYLSSSVFSVLKYDDDLVTSIELHSTTDYFRSVVRLDSVDVMHGDAPVAFRVLNSSLAETENDAVSLVWSASNSEIPQVTVAHWGLMNMELTDDWVTARFLVSDVDGQFLEGCAYIPVD